MNEFSALFALSAARSRGSSWVEAGVVWIDDPTIVFQTPDSTGGSPSCESHGNPPGRGLRSNESEEFNDIFRATLGWGGNLGYILRVHAKEFNSFRRKTRSKALYKFRLHRQEKFLYICDTLHMWEWDIQVLDIHEGTKEDEEPACLGGRGATPPEICGGPTGHRLMLKRQSAGSAMLAPAMVETGILMLAEACPDQPPQTWDLLRTAMDDGLRSIDLRLKESGPLEPERFSLQEANERLRIFTQRRRFWA